jgi:hypothetical protein
MEVICVHLSEILTNWSHQTVTIQHATSSFDAEGNPVLSTSSANTALIIQQNKVVRAIDGQEKVSSCQIFFAGNSTIGYNDTITLPDGSQPVILSIEYMPDFDGVNEYVRVYT